MPNILLIIIRSFIDNFLNYYIEQLIYSIRSANKKKVKDMELSNYKFKFLKCYDNVNTKELHDDPTEQNTNNLGTRKRSFIYTDAKHINNDNHGHTKSQYKKYNFPVKKIEKSWKSNAYNPAEIYKRINEDMRSFVTFLESFKEDAKEPFSKNFAKTLGANYINTYINKFVAIMDVLKCTQNALKDSITYLYKESFSGIEGKVLLEALLFIREDYKAITKSADLKKYFISLYDNN